MRTRFPILLVTLALALGACSRKQQYSQATPDDTIRSAVAMIKNGDTRRLSDLLYAESPEMREFLNHLGRLLGDMQTLSIASAERFPDEFKKLQDEALAAASDPKNKSLAAQLMVGMQGFDPSQAKNRRPDPEDLRAGFSAMLADPFGWIDRNAARLSTVKTADDTASVMFDGEPAIPIVGLPMKEERGKWYIVLPINMPPINQVMPRSRHQWSILASAVDVTDNAVTALTTDVEAGRVLGLKNLTDKFQEKILLPVGIAFIAYGKEIDVRQRVDRRTSALRTRLRTWSENRAKERELESPSTAVSPRLTDAVLTIAPERVEKLVRANKPLGVDKMSDPDFEDLISGWLAESGLALKFDGDLGAATVDKPIAAWQAERRAKTLPGAKRAAKKK